MSHILIVGLGNPGKKYEKSRHNAGFLAIDALAKKVSANFSEKANLHSLVAEINHEDKKLILIKPTTFMNNSGQAVKAIAEHYKITLNNIWVLSDDVTLPLGTLRVRKNGTAGGHNGLKSIIEYLGSTEFIRFKLGVDAPPENVPLEAWVLSNFSNDELIVLKETILQTIEAISEIIKNGMDTYGNRTI